MKKNILVVSVFIITSCGCDNCCDHIEGLYSQSADSTKIYWCLDGKHVSEEIIINALTQSQIETEFGSSGSRHAVTVFGEKYRKGIHALKTVE